jgi:hypothetical protein
MTQEAMMPLPPNQVQSKAFVTLSELAEDILGISRARLYELIERGSMPQPIYDLRTRRPLFDQTLQRQALAVRQTGIGVDGSVVIWYRRNRQTPAASSSTPSRARQRTSSSQRSYAELVSNLQSLGVSNADERSVAAAVAECFPNGIETQQDSDVLRVLFRHLRRRESA